MTDLEELLTNASNEIRSLRRRNELLSAKVEMIDLFALVFHTRPASPSAGYAPDVVFALSRKIAELQQEERNRPPAELAR